MTVAGKVFYEKLKSDEIFTSLTPHYLVIDHSLNDSATPPPSSTKLVYNNPRFSIYRVL